MGYIKTNWTNRVLGVDGTVISEGTPLSATNLNKIENGIENAFEKIGGTITGLVTIEPSNSAYDYGTPSLDFVDSGTDSQNASLIRFFNDTNKTKFLSEIKLQNQGVNGASGGHVIFSTNSTNTGTPSEIMRVANTGNVGIGTSTPTEKLDVTGNIKASGNVLSSNLPNSMASGVVQVPVTSTTAPNNALVTLPVGRFTTTPIIIVSAESTVPGTAVTETSFGNASSTSFRIYIYRTTLVNTNVNWIAVEM